MIRDTSIAAYRKIEADGTLKKLKWDVYSTLFKHGPLTQMEVASKLGAGSRRPSYTPRFAELNRIGVIKDIGVRKCAITGTEVTLWDVTSKLPKKGKDLKADALKAQARYRKAKEHYRIAVDKWRAAGSPV